MDDGLDLTVARNFANALLIGALVGIEREKRKTAEPEPGIGGLRTFIIMALIGALGGWLTDTLHSPVPVATTVLVVGMVVLAGYVLAARAQPTSLGITTEGAAIVVCLLGAMTTLGHREIAVALGIVTAAVLAYKQPLHGLVAKINWDDLYAALRLLIATFIVLPLLPNRALDPWGALNPYSLWLLVLLISSLSLVGYIGCRWLGSEQGIVLTGLMGGLVSSTAVTLSFARQSRDGERTAAPGLACGLVLAWCVMFARVVVEVVVVNRELASRVLVPFALMGGSAAISAFLLFRFAAAARERSAAKPDTVPLRNPFSLTQASKFGAFFALILLLVKLVQRYFPGQGLYMLAGVAGLTDVDAITLSMADYARAGDPRLAANAIVIAALSNTLVKVGIVVALGSAALRGPVLVSTAAILAAGLGAIVWS